MDILIENERGYNDIPILSRFANHGVNQPIPLYEGELVLHTATASVAGRGVVELSLLPSPRVQFRVEISQMLPDVSEIKVEIPSRRCSADAIVSTTHISNSISVSGELNGSSLEYSCLKEDGSAESFGRVEFHLLNFVEYWGKRIHPKQGADCHTWTGRIDFEFDKWHITLDQFPNISELLKEAKATSGFAITHIGILRRKDNNLFSSKEAKEILEYLYWLFSFVKGNRCGYILPKGLSYSGVPLWEEWGAQIVTPAAHITTWFAHLYPFQCFELAQGFFSLWKDPDKQSWIRLAVNLYALSNPVLHDDVALINAQTALELLSYVALVEESSTKTPEEFKKLKGACERFEELAKWCCIPLSIPASLSKLNGCFPSASGPEAITTIRNSIMHPTKANREKRQAHSIYVVYEAWQLSMHYIELAILKLMGYSGPYHNRITNPSAFYPDLVPWAIQPNE